MEIKIAISPRLPVEAAAFSAAWNEIAACRWLAEARPGQPEQETAYLPAELAQGLVLLGGFVGGAAAAATGEVLKERIKQVLNRLLDQKAEYEITYEGNIPIFIIHEPKER